MFNRFNQSIAKIGKKQKKKILKNKRDTKWSKFEFTEEVDQWPIRNTQQQQQQRSKIKNETTTFIQRA